jgi:hypothetical protein
MDVDTTLFQPVLMLAAFLCSLVAGFLFAFAAVVMPGIGKLDRGASTRAFQVIDGGHPEQSTPVSHRLGGFDACGADGSSARCMGGRWGPRSTRTPILSLLHAPEASKMRRALAESR